MPLSSGVNILKVKICSINESLDENWPNFQFSRTYFTKKSHLIHSVFVPRFLLHPKLYTFQLTFLYLQSLPSVILRQNCCFVIIVVLFSFFVSLCLPLSFLITGASANFHPYSPNNIPTLAFPLAY